MATTSSGSGFKSLDSEVQFLKGVGPKNAVTLAKLGIKTVGDMLFYLPRRYEDRTTLPPMTHLKPGQFATVRGRIAGFDARTVRGGKVIIKVSLTDGMGAISLVWFNQPWVARKLKSYSGDLIAYGQVKEAGWSYEMHSPEYELLDEEDDGETFAQIVPVYPLSEGVNQWLVRKAAASAIAGYVQLVQDPLPESIRREQKLRPLGWCLRQLHHPESENDRLEARKRLVFEDFFYMQVAMAMRRQETLQEPGIAFPISEIRGSGAGSGTLFGASTEGTVWDEVHQMLPFQLTNAQTRVIGEIWRDMEAPHPMNRLVQGDVGSGKTAVAASAILAAVRCGYQAAMMAPTEILAEQHYVSLRELFDPLGIEVTLLVGKLTATQKKKAAAATKNGIARIAVGTHALIQEGVEFEKLGLIVVDEQHRFGVLQRAALRGKGYGNPDVLVMTATPIPRTLTMTIYGDLSLSVIDEMPPGRKPIKTHWKFSHQRESVYDSVRKLIADGRQAYFVCPMVSENEKLVAQAAEDLHYRLTHEVYPDLRVGLLHGQLKAKEKETVMESFRKHELDILVSTTVIEVGVDVANASVMVIEDANRFGLSQLHQLRGRVGRGEHQSYCILIADAKTEDARARLDVMVATSDGFKIAEEDLRLRGPGEVAGTRQSGNLDFKVADLIQDSKMLEVARQAAIDLLSRDQTLAHPDHQTIKLKAQNHRSDLAVIVVS
ncbi:MAG: ATP-dependent DNA helicase RecG [Fimbriimonadaceae bacterium]|nr:ATP-dependent DNA helicase RecG [Fimbriimonadaceae bacterium]